MLPISLILTRNSTLLVPVLPGSCHASLSSKSFSSIMRSKEKAVPAKGFVGGWQEHVAGR